MKAAKRFRAKKEAAQVKNAKPQALQMNENVNVDMNANVFADTNTGVPADMNVNVTGDVSTDTISTNAVGTNPNDDVQLGEVYEQASITRTAAVSNVIELEPSYRTRYGAWCGIIILWLASTAAVLLRGDAPEWLMLTTISLIIVFSGIFPWLGAYRISYERNISAMVIEQGELSVSIHLKRRLALPGVWYAIDDQLHNGSAMRDHRLKLRAGFMPLFHRSMSLTYRICDMERGSYEAAPTVIRIGDWLGLTCIKVERTHKARLIVLPRLQQPEEESYVARNTSSRWLKKRGGATYHQDSSNKQQSKDYAVHSKFVQEDVLGAGTRPYAAGDSYRRIDQRAAARGRGLHTRTAEAEETSPRLCTVLDQYDLPYRDAQQDQMFSSLISWCLADTVEAGERQNVSVLCDNWSFEYTGQQDAAELKYLLAMTRPDVSVHMKDRVAYMSMLLPSGGHIVVYSGAWKDSEGWLALAEAALLKGSRLELQFVTTNRVMTYAMREQQKIMEQAGIHIVWRYSCEKPEPAIEVEKGSERYASGA